MIRPLNNNVVLAKDIKTGREVIAMGKGLGFSPGARGTLLDTHKVEKVFFFLDEAKHQQYFQLLKIIDEDIIQVAEEIISIASHKLGSPLNEHIHLALPDHIGFAIERVKKGIEIPNLFLNEIQILYPEEYAIAGEALRLIRERIGVILPEEEQGFLALHLYAARRNQPPKTILKHTTLIQKIINNIEKELGIAFQEGEIAYIRLVTHLKLALECITSGKNPRNPLLDKIKTEFYDSYQLAIKLARIMEEELCCQISEDEIGYLALHLQRLKVYSKLDKKL
ncbi:transcriptional antiterminator, BglG family [Thermanaeromonas toyohensis ToBE]|uniref:Transcriptional antiterminator, BglG family n=1 Tax=Thermanaeromonas toyohensis ToBE TaxID=698762 RepID=A0A1W1W3M1_9FIRM|nr:transcriptional antiterminator, BglG family [Thermanaeromonas toyohensis ToBE]